jgi:carbamoyltransferase
MKILGIHDGHNATAALMIDGQIVAMISEERLTYRKNEMGFPERAIVECLNIAGINGNDLDKVAFSTISIPIHYLRIKREFSFSIRDFLDEQEEYWKPLLFENRVNTEYLDKIFNSKKFNEPQAYSFMNIPYNLTPAENKKYLDEIRKETLYKFFGISADKVISYDHHICHQYYAYFGSSFRDKKAIVFTADGGGDGANGTVSIVENNQIKELGRNNCTDLARIYRYITLLLGMRIGEHEYKVMGLSPYASEYEIRKCDKVFKDVFYVPELLIEYKNRPSDLFFHFRDNLADCRFDGIAGGVQEMIEEVGKEWFHKVTKKLNVSRVVFSGGLSMNVKLNKVIGELDSVNEFYCPASGGDESVALGACYVAHTQYSQMPVSSIENNYLGPQFTRLDILKAITKLKDYKIIEGVTNKKIAQLLAQNLVIGRFVGRMEFGARSLGNRSILANPANQEIVQKINRKIKFRDFWMPFAPSILDKYADKYLINPKKFTADHMTHSFDVTELGRKALIAAIHPADYTVRAHIVTRKNNQNYYDLIELFSELTGIGALLNTSFNLHGYPIVCTPEHAVHVFENSDLDGMVLEDILVMRLGIKY